MSQLDLLKRSPNPSKPAQVTSISGVTFSIRSGDEGIEIHVPGEVGWEPFDPQKLSAVLSAKTLRRLFRTDFGISRMEAIIDALKDLGEWDDG